MKLFSRIIGVCLSLTILLSTAAVNAAPRLTIPETSFDFGYVPQNAKVSHKFWLLSTGEDTLRILKIVPG